MGRDEDFQNSHERALAAHYADEVLRLEQDIVRLKAEVRRLEKEVADLEAQLGRSVQAACKKEVNE